MSDKPLEQIDRRFAPSAPKSVVDAMLSRVLVKGATKTAATPASGPEHIDSRELARRWNVSKRWIDDQTRSKDDPIPAFKRGRMVRYLWNSNDPQNALNLWWSRHTETQAPSRRK